MSALTILIIRHGEKPDPPAIRDPGITPGGTQDIESLLVRGWQRAGAWAALFGSGLGGGDYPQPGVIYAVNPAPDPQDPASAPSQRPFQTIMPLAARLHLAPRIQFGQDLGQDLATEVSALTGVVLISWEHKRIGEVIVPALLNRQNPPGVPKKWQRDRFDVVLRFDRALPGAPLVVPADVPTASRRGFGSSDVSAGRDGAASAAMRPHPGHRRFE